MFDSHTKIETNTSASAFATFLASPNRGKLRDFEAISHNGNKPYTVSIFTGSVYTIRDQADGTLQVLYISPSSSGTDYFFTKLTREQLYEIINKD
ncbi:hypothetical protein L292_1761 [Acinetobacter junii CIP 107470 = MTCC 11364]|uniref:Uncharacterized protein n=1 Tax=Acinetobacter junii CIP 107470 = MTCC 11364 TaxID=1217666 RepID=S7WB64_ACIJU|nr:hypothetical protein [Acinetobacter junii]ENV52059.1 hypothetical protein F953_00471 [Acinetobacter junii CIP 107470 = MTCC 11364]EPR80176.1 hypothetical protein L292_1761 [Acinetobacter junii CIP 107470 = MTCC 11364]